MRLLPAALFGDGLRAFPPLRGVAGDTMTLPDAELLALVRKQSPSWEPQELPAWIASKRQVQPGALPILPTPWQEDIRRIRSPSGFCRGDRRSDHALVRFGRAPMAANGYGQASSPKATRLPVDGR
jgi:hypothetical protein